jgi:UDP-N-acetylglucosamine 3-dehydrogenase
MDKVRFGVIGTGFWGRNHARVLSELPQTSLVAVCDLDAARGKSIADKYDAQWYPRYEDILQAKEVEAVSICTPTTTHAEIALKGAKHGKDMLIEKPIADNVDDARRIVEVCKASKLKTMTGFIERFNPGTRALKDLIENGALGEVVLALGRRLNRWPERIGDVGVLKDSAIHDVDLMRYLFQEEPVSIYARAGSIGHRFEDYVEIMMRFSGIRTGFVEANWLTPHKVRTLTITGREALAEMDFITQQIVVENISEIVTKKRDWAEPLRLELEHFAKRIREGRDPDVTAYDGLRALEICEAALRSSETGEAVRLSKRENQN